MTLELKRTWLDTTSVTREIKPIHQLRSRPKSNERLQEESGNGTNTSKTSANVGNEAVGGTSVGSNSRAGWAVYPYFAA